ncbi:hypothetical protein [Neptunicella sp. SCSIO 80796]|uniref:hypothetical protein n=1 Tax=Neptunicella plasticusilytica TaxID=3117012 RepID=UPI003A4DF19E
MINDISAAASKNSTSPVVNSAAEESNFFSDGIDSFKNLMKDIGLFDDQETVTSTGQTNITDNQLTDVVEQVTSNVFDSSSGQAGGLSKFSAEDISTLQQSLVDALKSSLLNGNQPNTQSAATQTTTENTGLFDSIFSGSGAELLQQANDFSFGEDGFGAKDVFDALNVLNSVPVVSDIYQQTTHSDTVSAFSSIAGSYLLGGPVGLAFAAADVATKEFTGESISANLIDLGMGLFESSAEQLVASSNSNGTGQTGSEVTTQAIGY